MLYVRANERFLVYRDFQHAIVKLARARYETSTDPYRSSIKDNQQAASALLQEIATRHAENLTETRVDALRRQLTKHSLLEVLELHLPKLIQSFQLYGKENAILAQTSRADALDTSSTILLDGFLDFLNAYFEYEEFFSFQQIEQVIAIIVQMVSEMKDALKKLENAITYQNMKQYHMALGALEVCKAHYKESRESAASLLDTEDVEVRVFFHLATASKDFQALQHHFEALKLADLLPPSHHPGRALVKSSLGCILYYAGEIGLAKKCHQQVLEARRLAPELGDEHIDTATAMNNLACCLSQDPTGIAMEEAFLLLKSAKRIYSEVFGASHPRVEVLLCNFERVRACQRMVVVDPQGALERGEYAHVIPGSRFQIRALVPIPKTAVKAGGGGGKKGENGAKKGAGGKKKKQ